MNACMHAQACTYMLKYICKEIANGCQYIYHDKCVCAHVQVHTCMHVIMGTCVGVAPPTYTPTHPPPMRTSIISKNLIHLEHIEIFQFEDLKCVETLPPMGGCMVWWVAGWMDWLMGGLMSNHYKFNKS